MSLKTVLVELVGEEEWGSGVKRKPALRSAQEVVWPPATAETSKAISSFKPGITIDEPNDKYPEVECNMPEEDVEVEVDDVEGEREVEDWCCPSEETVQSDLCEGQKVKSEPTADPEALKMPHVDPLHSMRTGPQFTTKALTAQDQQNQQELVLRHYDPHQCPTCNKILCSRRSLKLHTLLHTGEKPYQCDLCKSKFTHRHNLILHMSRLHSEEPQLEISQSNKRTESFPLYEGGVCYKAFTAKDDLIENKLIQTGDSILISNTAKKQIVSQSLSKNQQSCKQERQDQALRHFDPHQCPTCNKILGSRRTLNVHTLIHTGEKPYQSGICKRKFTQSYNVVLHKMRAHKREKTQLRKFTQFSHSGFPLYECNICYKDFTLKTDLIAHKRTHTEESVAISNTTETQIASKALTIDEQKRREKEKPILNLLRPIF